MCLCNLFNDSSTLFLLIAALILIWYFSCCQSGCGSQNGCNPGCGSQNGCGCGQNGIAF